MSSLVPIEVLAETTLPNIATKVASEPISPHRIMQRMNTGHANVTTVMFILVEFHIK